jgi:RNA polymerase sigma factor (sigma-70 family)
VAQLADTRGLEAVVLRPRFGRRRSPGARERSESELLARIRGGDDTAFEALYDAYHRRLLAFCQHMLGSREEAEDVLQNTFMAAYRSLRAGYEVVELKPWLYTIARNRCLSVMRARREEVELDERAPAIGGLAAEVDRRADLRTLVRDVQRLPPDQRAALVLFEVGDQSHEEIAAVLGVRREKVKALVFQAREALMGWRTARETPCAHVREQLATLRGRALGRATIRRHVEQCSGCADYEAAVRCQRAALAVALPVAPAAAGLRAAVLGSAAGRSGLGAAVGAGGATSAAGGPRRPRHQRRRREGPRGHRAGGRRRGCAAGDRGPAAAGPRSARGARARCSAVAERGATDRDVPPPSRAPPRPARRAAADPPRHARTPAAAGAVPGHHRGAAAHGHGAHTAMAAGKAAAPGQRKAAGAPAEGKALGHANTKASTAKPAHGRSGGKGSAPKPAKTKAVSGASPTPAQGTKPAKAPKPAPASKLPKGAATVAPSAPAQSSATPATPGHGDAVPPGQAKKLAEPPRQP